MTQSTEQIARRAAQRLATDIDRPLLIAEVERHLDNQTAPEAATYEPVTVSVAAFIVSIASLAWTIYNDIKNRGGQVDQEVVSRRIRVMIKPSDNFSESERDRIVDVVVEETVKQRP